MGRALVCPFHHSALGRRFPWFSLGVPHNTTGFHGFSFMGFRLFGHMLEVRGASEREHGGLIAAR